MKKLKAFTLMELLIGMIISSIVIAFSYGAYTMIYKQYLNFKQTKMKLMDVSQFNSVMQNDFIRANAIHFKENNLLLTNEKNVITLQYKFLDTYISRTDQEVIDTFHLNTENIKSNFIHSSGAITTDIINELSFESLVFGEKEYFTFVKTYSAETLLSITELK